MSTFVNVLVTDDGHWVVESSGGRVAYESRGAAISAGVHQAIEESAYLMIYEREADASAPMGPGGVD